MNKLLAIITIFSITVLSVNGGAAVPGNAAACGTASSPAGTACVTSCGVGYAADSNQICQYTPALGAAVSCGTASSPAGGTTCVTSCGVGYVADSNQICQYTPALGNAVSCGTASSPAGEDDFI
ncbi:hypothetical protein ABPG74_019114 [Tetrahymena malaccensis]